MTSAHTAPDLRGEIDTELERVLAENALLREALQTRFHPDNIVGRSKAMQQVYAMIERVTGSDATVLIRGESGVGKELVARAIHVHGARAAGPFVTVNCAALPSGLLESELFGHERGAFTGAHRGRKGRFELAHRGTLFLDEIGDLPASTQVLLLRVLQEREFERVGGDQTIATDVRIIAATNRDLEALITHGSFREDLYYRLNVYPIRVPPLRERGDDITLLIDFFVERFASSHGKRIVRVSTPAIDMLTRYHWPGNVRELENCLERAALLSTDGVIHGYHLPPTLQTPNATDTSPKGTLQSILDRVEHDLIVDALKDSNGNMAAAARALGLTERAMGLRVRKHGIQPRTMRTRRRRRP